jgi:Lhr-like helicase
MSALDDFHPAVAGWFRRSFTAPTEPQERAWPAIRSGRDVLIAAPTGSGKTLAAFLAAIDALVRTGVNGGLRDETTVVYVSPLKALSNDIHKNLEEPLAGIRRELAALGLLDAEIRTLVRTGDTPQAERERMRRKPPHILVTTRHRAHGDRGRDPRAGTEQARRPPRAVAGAPRARRRGETRARRAFRHTEAGGGSRGLPHRQWTSAA